MLFINCLSWREPYMATDIKVYEVFHSAFNHYAVGIYYT